MPEQDQNANNQNNQGDNNQGQGGTPSTWDDALKALPAEVQALYTQHVTGLQNTVRATREERDTLRNQLKDLLPKAEKGSELEKSLTEFGAKLEAAERRAQFAEEAVKPEIGCRNIKAAYALALADNLFDRRGAPDWQAIKAAAPELFGQPQANGNAGAGTGGGAPQKTTMNDFIRRAAGRS